MDQNYQLNKKQHGILLNRQVHNSTSGERVNRQNAMSRKDVQRDSNYKTFSPILSSTSRSVKALMDNIQEAQSDVLATKRLSQTQKSRNHFDSNKKRSVSIKQQRKFSPIDCKNDFR